MENALETPSPQKNNALNEGNEQIVSINHGSKKTITNKNSRQLEYKPHTLL
jgi:hypothetical protein